MSSSSVAQNKYTQRQRARRSINWARAPEKYASRTHSAPGGHGHHCERGHRVTWEHVKCAIAACSSGSSHIVTISPRGGSGSSPVA